MIQNVPEIREAVEQDLNCIAKVNNFNSLERIRGNFELISEEFKIGEGYNAKSIEATIEDGMLTVFVPNYKKQEKKRISIL